MTLDERNALLASMSFHAKVRVALCDWMNYWVSAGTDLIQDETVRMQTEAFIRMIIENLDDCTSRVAVLAIANSNIANLEDEPTDQNVKAAVDSIMTTSLSYLL